MQAYDNKIFNVFFRKGHYVIEFLFISQRY